MMSRLPQDLRYWEELTDRIVANAYRKASRAWWRRIARFSMPLALGAAAAVVAALIWRPEPFHEPAPDSSRASLYGFVPADPLAVAFLTSATAPTMTTLIAISERTQ